MDTEITNIALADIDADDLWNTRGMIAPGQIVGLAQSIERTGLLQPVVVRTNAAGAKRPYTLVAGFRRYHAHRFLNRDTIAAVIKGNISDLDALLINLLENLDRQNLDIGQEAEAVNRLLREGLQQKEVAAKLGMSTAWVNTRVKFLDLPKEIQSAAIAGSITQSQVIQLAAILKTSGLKSCMEQAKAILAAKAKGKKPRPVKTKDHTRPQRRNQDDIFFMMETIRLQCGSLDIHKIFAWCAGTISDLALFNFLVDNYTRKDGSPFSPDEAIQRIKDREYYGD